STRLRLTTSSTLFPYTTLFRSLRLGGRDDESKGQTLARGPGDLQGREEGVVGQREPVAFLAHLKPAADRHVHCLIADAFRERGRSEEHTSELQSRENLVCRLLL